MIDPMYAGELINASRFSRVYAWEPPDVQEAVVQWGCLDCNHTTGAMNRDNRYYTVSFTPYDRLGEKMETRGFVYSPDDRGVRNDLLDPRGVHPIIFIQARHSYWLTRDTYDRVWEEDATMYTRLLLLPGGEQQHINRRFALDDLFPDWDDISEVFMRRIAPPARGQYYDIENHAGEGMPDDEFLYGMTRTATVNITEIIHPDGRMPGQGLDMTAMDNFMARLVQEREEYDPFDYLDEEEDDG